MAGLVVRGVVRRDYAEMEKVKGIRQTFYDIQHGSCIFNLVYHAHWSEEVYSSIINNMLTIENEIYYQESKVIPKFRC